MSRLAFASVFFWACTMTAPAGAADLRMSVTAHNVRLWGGDTQSDESGPNLELEAVGGRLRALHVIGAPRPYAMISANLNGDTSFAATGLYWRVPIGHSKWTLEPGFGVAVHDGELRNPYPPGGAEADAFARQHQLLGARVLFRDTLALDRRIGARRSLGIVFEHLSNGGALFGHADNQSLNEIALRYTVALR